MSSQQLMRRLLSFIVLVSVILLMSYMLMTVTVSSGTTADWSQIWVSFDNLTSSVFLPLPHDANASYRVPHGVAAEVRPQCQSRPSDDTALRDVCRPLLAGKNSPLRPAGTAISAAEYAQRTDNCDCFRSNLDYFVSPEDTTDEERRFPIAFSLLTYENLEQSERLLRLIYRPHNVYCIHVDATSSDQLRDGLEAIASCFDNVFVAKPPVDVRWGKVSIIHAEILCMKQLLNHKRWKYLVNLVGRDFPLRTNYELVKILQTYDGANDVQASRNEEK